MAELLDPSRSPPRLHHSANGDLASSLGSLSSHERPDLLKLPSSVHKFPLANGDYSRHASNKRQPSHGDINRSKSFSLHGDHRLILSSKLPRLLILPFKRRFLVVCFSLALLMLAFSVFPTVRSYPGHMHPFLVRHREAFSFPLLRFLHTKRLNQTLLALAKMDLGEELDRVQVNNILDGTWSRTSTYSRYSYMRDRYRHDDHYKDGIYDRHRLSRAGNRRLPIQLTAAQYRPFWTQFRGSLRSWVQNKRYDPQIMTQLLSTVKERVDQHYMASNQSVNIGKPYKACAVVGNSGILLNQSHGSLIDSHDMVMRLNNARISGFEKHVGSKTTLSFVNSNIFHSCAHRRGCYCHPYGTNVPLIMYICQVIHLMDVETCGSSLQAPIIVTDPRFDTLCARIVKYYSLKRFVEATGRRLEDWSRSHEGPLFHYSSGMQAVLLAVGLCKKVSVFGFGKSEKSKHHYHTSQRVELQLHDYQAEYDFYMDLVLRNAEIIPFLHEAGFSLPSVHIYW